MLADLTALSDDQVVALCLERGAVDERPWTELYRRHRQLVWSVCRRYFRNREDVADMVQESFLRALRGLGGFRGGHPALLRAWLVRIAGNTCKNELRHRARRLQPVDEEVTPEMAVTASDAGAKVDAAGRRARFDEAFEALSAVEREILQLADLEELPYPDIATRLGLSLSAVKMRVIRARAVLSVAIRLRAPEEPPS